MLEVGSGAGLLSLTIAKSFLSREGGVLVSCDFSKGMVRSMLQRYEESDFANIEGNKFLIDAETDYADL